MEEHGCGEHCPFLNRSDRRCSSFLSLDRITHAFDHCFGEYKSCPVYLELLVERRVRRLCGLLAPAAGDLAGDGSASNDSAHTDGNLGRPVVQLTVSKAPAHRHAQLAAATQSVPASSRF